MPKAEEGTKRMTVDLPEKLYWRIKQAAATEGKKIRDYVGEALEAYLVEPKSKSKGR